MTPDDEHAEDIHVVNALTAMQRHIEAMTEAMCALHIQATELQSVLCAVIDTHPEPAGLLQCFERQMAHTLQLVRPHDLAALNSQTQAWVDRINRRTVALAAVTADASPEIASLSGCSDPRTRRDRRRVGPAQRAPSSRRAISSACRPDALSRSA